MKVKLVRSLHGIPFDPNDPKSGKSWVMNDLLAMENQFSMVGGRWASVEIDFRPYICYAPLEILQKCLKHLSKLERQGFITIDRNWDNVELEHPFVAKRVRDLMYLGDIKSKNFKVVPYGRTTPHSDVGGYWE